MLLRGVSIFGLLIILNVHVEAQQCPTPPRLRRRMQAVDPGNYEISSRVANDPEMTGLLRQILTEFRDIDDIRPQFECLSGRNKTLARVRGMVKNLGLGEFDGCMSRIDYEYTIDHMKKAKNMHSALRRFEDGFRDMGESTVKNINTDIIPNGAFENAVMVGDLPWSVPNSYHECNIHRADAFRINGVWNFVAEITNVLSTENVPARSRYFYRELFQYNTQLNETRVQPVSIPKCQDNALTKFQNGTAWLEVWGGTTNASMFLEGDVETNPALRSVLDSLDGKETDIVMDSDTASNIAILLLPVTLALIPLSLFQDVGTLVTVFYVIATDVMSVLPVAIKGVELLILSSHTHYARSAFVYGSAQSEILAVEMWVSECHLKRFVTTRGIILLCVALSATVIGLVLEFAIRHQVEKYKRINNSNLAKELEIDERHSLDVDRRSSLYSERVVNYIQKGGTGGLLFHMEQKKEFREAP